MNDAGFEDLHSALFNLVISGHKRITGADLEIIGVAAQKLVAETSACDKCGAPMAYIGYWQERFSEDRVDLAVCTSVECGNYTELK